MPQAPGSAYLGGMAHASVSPEDLRRAVLVPLRRSRGDIEHGPHRFAPGAVRRRAAVLCAVVPRETGLQVVLTRRPDTMPTHPGQIAFPGGKVDRTDRSPLATALREAHEEIGLHPGLADVIGPLDPYVTRSGFVITPFVAMVAPSFRPMPCAREVAAVFEAPLDHLMDPANHRRHSRVWQGQVREFWAMPWQAWFIWGATAGMLRGLAERLAHARDEPPPALPAAVPLADPALIA